jgi:hypothetical protein
MDFSKLIEWIKLSPKYLIPIAFVSGFIVFAKEKTLSFFGLLEIVARVKPWISIIFLLSIALILSSLIFLITNIAKSKIANNQKTKKGYEKLNSLTPSERQFLKFYIREDHLTQYCPYGQLAELTELLAYEIVYEPASTADMFKWPININPWAYKYLKENHQKIFGE